MIIDIQLKDNVTRHVDYHFKKCEMGVATRLNDNVLANDAKSAIDLMDSTIDQNPNVRSNRYLQGVISFHKDERVVTDSELDQVLSEWMEKMGYQDNDFIHFRHYDKDHQHSHFVITQVDHNGKSVNYWNQRYRSTEIAQEIIKEKGFREYEVVRDFKSNLKEINAERYSLYNAIHKHKESLVNEFPEVEKLPAEALKNSELKQLPLYSKSLENKLKKEGKLFVSEKSLLRSKIVSIKRDSSNTQEFYDKCKEQGVYVRKVSDKLDNLDLEYGMKREDGSMFYCSSTKLSKATTLNAINSIQSERSKLSNRGRVAYLNKHLIRSIEKSKSFNEFKNHLERSGIGVVESRRNDGSLYGMSFLNLNDMSQGKLKLSEVTRKITIKDILEGISANQSEQKTKAESLENKTSKSTKDNTPSLGQTAKDLEKVNKVDREYSDDIKNKKRYERQADENRNEIDDDIDLD